MRSKGDLTARARIRNAAVELFAADGFERTSLRAIAASAGVTSGLVVHHFGGKDGLRTACDAYVLDQLLRRARDAGSVSLLQEYLSDPDQYHVHINYMSRALADDSPAAATFVDAIVAASEATLAAGAADGTMRPSSDVRALAVLSVLTSLATLTMPPALVRALGAEEFGPDVLRRLAVPTLEIYTHGLYADDTALTAAKEWNS